MVTIIQMKLEDSYKIRDIDRSERIDLIRKSFHDTNMNSLTVGLLLEHLTEINWLGLEF